MWHSTMTCLFSAAHTRRINRPASPKEHVKNWPLDRYHFKSVAACVMPSLRWTRQSTVRAWIIHYQGYGWRTSSTNSVPTVCGLYVCLRAQADTGIHRGIHSDRHQDKRACGVATLSSLRWLHRVRVVWLPIISEYYVHVQTNWPIIT